MKVKKIASIFMAVMLVLTIIPSQNVIAKSRKTTDLYKYVLFADKVKIDSDNTNINGDIYSHEGNKQDIQGNINGKLIINKNEQMIDKQRSIIADFILGNCFGNEEAQTSDDNINYSGHLSTSLGSLRDIEVNNDTINSDNIVLYSKDGNITINSNNFNFRGLIYAPNGEVKIKGDNINIQGAIISNKIHINAKHVNINSDSFFAEYLAGGSDLYHEQKDMFTYNYDIFGNVVSIFNGSKILVDYKYTYSLSPKLISEVYGNGTFKNIVDKNVEQNNNINNYLCNNVPNESSAYTYQFDSNYNIETKSQNNKSINYIYDDKDQLVRVNDSISGLTYTYSYDKRGNITSKNEYTYSEGDLQDCINKQSFNYDSKWKDQLLQICNDKITYDNIGNPLTYKDWNFTWQQGRQLASASNDKYTIQYKYNKNGLRTSKIVNGKLTAFSYINNKIVEQHNQNDNLIFKYDSNSNIVGVNINGNDYYYVKNQQGDVDKIINSNGNVVVEYYYDPWGKLLNCSGELSDTIGLVNPIRYRGYYYDEDLQLYYLINRYYDSATGRFINCDDFCFISSDPNLYKYCNNNPIRNIDNDGLFSWSVSYPGTINSYYDQQKFDLWCKDHPQYYFDSYATRLGYYESNNNYRVTNTYGYMGYWQMGLTALVDIGYKNSNGTWTTKANNLGIYSNANFLNNPTAQDRIFIEYCCKQWYYIKYYGLTSYVGKSYCGVSITDSGLLAAAHLVGAKGLSIGIKNNTVPGDANGTKATGYMNYMSGYNVTYIK